jgi:hypothetical protein
MRQLCPRPDGSSLVSCCPGLQHLDMWGARQYGIELLAPLQGLSGLHTLRLNSDVPTDAELQAVCQLTGLRQLEVALPHEATQAIMLTQLKHLTRLVYEGPAVHFHDNAARLQRKGTLTSAVSWGLI